MPLIYLKREDLNHTGAHKINNALGQALLCKRMGKTRIIAETGAGQHGVATVRTRMGTHAQQAAARRPRGAACSAAWRMAMLGCACGHALQGEARALPFVLHAAAP